MSFSHRRISHCNGKDLLTDHAKKASVSKDALTADLRHQFFILCLQFFSFQTCQVHEDAYPRLPVPVHRQPKRSINLLCHLYVSGTTDDADHFINIIQRLKKTLQNMCTLSCLVQIILCSSVSHNIFLMLQIVVQHLFQIQTFGSLLNSASMITPKVSCSCVCFIQLFQITLALASLRSSMQIRIPSRLEWSFKSVIPSIFCLVQALRFSRSDVLCLPCTGAPYTIIRLLPFGNSLDIRHRTDTDLAASCL